MSELLTCRTCLQSYDQSEFISEHTGKQTKLCFECRLGVKRRASGGAPRFPFRPVLAEFYRIMQWEKAYGVPHRSRNGRVAETCGGINTRIAEILWDAPSSNCRRLLADWRTNGLTVKMADRIAVKLGKHPIELWPNFWDEYQESKDGRRAA